MLRELVVIQVNFPLTVEVEFTGMNSPVVSFARVTFGVFKVPAPFVVPSAPSVVAINSIVVLAWLLAAGANHHRVVTPTGNVYFACIPRNSIVAVTGVGFQFITTMETCDQSLEDTLVITYAPTLRAQLRGPPTETLIRCPKGPAGSMGIIAFDA